MTAKLHDPLTEALESIKAGGLIRKYSMVWADRSEAPRIALWKGADISDDELRRIVVHSLAGLAVDSQLSIEKD